MKIGLIIIRDEKKVGVIVFHAYDEHMSKPSWVGCMLKWSLKHKLHELKIYWTTTRREFINPTISKHDFNSKYMVLFYLNSAASR